jgi:hypothetical protein
LKVQKDWILRRKKKKEGKKIKKWVKIMKMKFMS